MSTDDLKKYFENYGPQKVTWINDSSATVLFETAEAAQNVYSRYALTYNSLGKLTSLFEIAQDQIDQRNYDSKIGWKEAVGY